MQPKEQKKLIMKAVFHRGVNAPYRLCLPTPPRTDPRCCSWASSSSDRPGTAHNNTIDPIQCSPRCTDVSFHPSDCSTVEPQQTVKSARDIASKPMGSASLPPFQKKIGPCEMSKGSEWKKMQFLLHISGASIRFKCHIKQLVWRVGIFNITRTRRFVINRK